MPVVNIDKKHFFSSLGKSFTDDEFDDLCFQFGLEVEFVLLDKEEVVKIEIPANRYDLLCEEGIVQALRVFLGMDKIPTFTVELPKLRVTVSKETSQIRPFIVCAVLHGVKFTKDSYKSFIDLQDKLHQNICRKRTLVAVGTHDLNSIKAPFRYEALVPEKISFVPLNKKKIFSANEFLTHCQTEDLHLKPYTSILKDSPVYPVLFDSKNTLFSFPPIINSEHSKMSEHTTEVFIECTATDRTKAYVVLNTMVTSFAMYCSKPFSIEQVEVVYPDGSIDVTPKLETREMDCKVDWISKRIGVVLKGSEMVKLLAKMQIPASVKDENTITCCIPPFRSDIFHTCDIMEDVAIGYGFNNLIKTTPSVVTTGKQLPLNKVSDLLRGVIANAGYTEVLTLVLLSKQDNFNKMNIPFNGKQGVILSNPKSQDYQMARTSLMPGLLNSLVHNLKVGLPIKLFEISDVIKMNTKVDVGCQNERNICALYCNTKGELEIIHGLLDRIMQSLVCKFEIRECHDDRFFAKRQAQVFVKGVCVGIFGILNPIVLSNFGINHPVCAIELSLELIQ
jgi:phenylalanyl-tRNA synthetase beta chain